MKTFRIHGDNIVECERIANIIINTIAPDRIGSYLVSPSTIAIEIRALYLRTFIEWRFELLPGFNKNTKRRWDGNIFDALKEAGSFFDETPDAIITAVDEDNNEKILLAIEFCSALQAGNQAWQRSARAFSTGRTGCPYIYIVDFVKYELDIEQIVLEQLRKIFVYATEDEGKFADMIRKQKAVEQGKKLREEKREYEKAKQRAEQLDTIIQRLYEDNICGKVSDERYAKMVANYEAEQEALNTRIAELQETLRAEQQAAWQISSFLQQVKKHTEITELNTTILREFISKIKVYSAVKDASGKRVQHIKIEYNFIGDLYIPDELQKETA